MNKNISLILIFLVIVYYSALAQEDVVSIEPERSDFKTSLVKLKNDDFTEIEKGFQQNDPIKLKPYLHPRLYKNLKQTLKSIKDSLSSEKWIFETHYEASSGGFHPFAPGGPHNTIVFNGSLDKSYTTSEISYTFRIVDSMLMINSIKFRICCQFSLEKTLPEELGLYADAAWKLKDINNWNGFHEKLSELHRLNNELISYDLSGYKPNLNPVHLSRSYGNLAWKLIFEKDYEKAILAAQKGLEADQNQTWIITNLALAYLLSNEYDKAKTVYINYANEEISKGKIFRPVFIEDLNKAKEAGLENPDFEKIYKILENKDH